MTVKFNDREEKVEHFHSALKLTGLNWSYEYADLVSQVHDLIEQSKGKTTLKDICDLKTAWEKKWEEYQKENK